jgi:hypothetical protein
MKHKHWLGAIGVLAIAAGVIGAPAHAAPSYTIYGSAVLGQSGTAQFMTSGCRAEVRSTVQGVDTVILDVSRQADTIVSVKWDGMATAAGVLGGGLAPTFITGACAQIFQPNTPGGVTPGTWQFHIPARTTWLAITSNNLANVSLTPQW